MPASGCHAIPLGLPAISLPLVWPIAAAGDPRDAQIPLATLLTKTQLRERMSPALALSAPLDEAASRSGDSSPILQSPSRLDTACIYFQHSPSSRCPVLRNGISTGARLGRYFRCPVPTMQAGTISAAAERE
jgi:hypothetical protein